MKIFWIEKILTSYRYNLLAACSLIISICNFALIYIIYGSSSDADTYFLLTNGINILFLLVESLVSNYSYDFRMIKTNDSRKSAYSTMLFYCSVFSVLLSIVFFFFNNSIFDFIFSSETQTLNRSIFLYFIHVSSLYLILQLNINSLNAIDRIGSGYFFSFFPQLFSLLSLILIYFEVVENSIKILIFFLMFGYLLSVLISTLVCCRWIGLTVRLNYKFTYAVLKKSLKSRSASNIHNIFINYFIVLIVSSSEPGMVSMFYYGKRVAEMFHLVIFGPFSKQMINIISDSWSGRNYKEYSYLQRRVFKEIPLLYLSALFLIIISLWILIVKLEMLVLDFKFIALVVLTFFVANIIIVIESLYSVISMLTASFRKIAAANIAFVIALIAVHRLGALFLSDIYALCISLVIGQLIVLIFHAFLNREMITKHYGCYDAS